MSKKPFRKNTSHLLKNPDKEYFRHITVESGYANAIANSIFTWCLNKKTKRKVVLFHLVIMAWLLIQMQKKVS